MAAGRRAVTIAEGLDSPYSLAAACIGLGYNFVIRGDPAASRVLERACIVAHDAKLTLFRPQAMRLLGSAYLLGSRIVEGVELIQKAADEVQSNRLLMQHAPVLTLLGEACRSAARVEEASTAARGALAFARERGQRGEEAVAMRVLGDIASHSNRFDMESARVHYRDALTLADELGMRPLAAHCHLGLGKLYRRANKGELAQDHLTIATTMYREMGMTYWREKAEGEMGDLQ